MAYAGSGLGALLVAPRALATRAGDAAAPGPTNRSYVSRPDLSPPVIDVATSDPTTSPGFIFLAPSAGTGQTGPLIVDNAGQPVWFLPLAGTTAHNFRVQQFRGRPVLTWWEGEQTNGHGLGDYVIADSTYQEFMRFGPANGYRGDLHDFVITSRGTALISVYDAVSADLTTYGGTTSGIIFDGIVQEIDLRTGKLLFEWHSLEHVDPSESIIAFDNDGWDYFHLNSIGVLPDGNLLVSARHTSTAYKLDRRSGTVIWRLGGTKSDFAFRPGAAFALQHDVRGHPGDVITVFDHGIAADVTSQPVSRAIVLQLDAKAMVASLVRADANPQGGLSTVEGNAQVLPDGGIFVGWGILPSYSEFSPSGGVRYDASLRTGSNSYRAFRARWKANPLSRPAIGTIDNSDRSLNVYVSWNGATEISHWRVVGGATATTLAPMRTVPRDGFETTIRLATAPVYLAAVALDARGHTLGTTQTLVNI